MKGMSNDNHCNACSIFSVQCSVWFLIVDCCSISSFVKRRNKKEREEIGEKWYSKMDNVEMIWTIANDMDCMLHAYQNIGRPTNTWIKSCTKIICNLNFVRVKFPFEIQQFGICFVWNAITHKNTTYSVKWNDFVVCCIVVYIWICFGNIEISERN